MSGYDSRAEAMAIAHYRHVSRFPQDYVNSLDLTRVASVAGQLVVGERTHTGYVFIRVVCAHEVSRRSAGL